MPTTRISWKPRNFTWARLSWTRPRHAWVETTNHRALLHSRVWSPGVSYLMRFLVRLGVQNAPYPTLHEWFFRGASRGLERKLSRLNWRQPSFFLLTWRYATKNLYGVGWDGFCTQNRIKIAKRAFGVLSFISLSLFFQREERGSR